MNSSKIRCLITAGPTREYFDPVRYITNPSSGKMGYTLVAAAIELGWDVDLVSGPVSLAAPHGASVEYVKSGEEMYLACLDRFPQCDILIMCAAVCDMRPKHYSKLKVKKEALTLDVQFEKTRDILCELSELKKPNQTLIGFAAETDNVKAHAVTKLKKKNLDYIVANSVAEGGAFESNSNSVQLIGRDGSDVCYGPALKQEIAKLLIHEINERVTVGCRG